jgi:hypothetical protein
LNYASILFYTGYFGDSVISQCSLSDQRFPILCVPHRSIQGRTHGYKWSLLKVRRGITKGRGGTRWKLEADSLSLFQVLLRLMVTYGKGRTK